MRMSAEHDLGAAGLQRAFGRRAVVHVDPFRVGLGACVDVEPSVVLEAHGEAGQELALRGAQLPPRPGHGDLCIRGHGLAGLRDGLIVVARHRDGTAGRHLHDSLQHVLGFRAVADIVSQEHEAVRALRVCMGQAGVQRTPVGVDVSHE